MKIYVKNLISITEANQNFSRVVKKVEENGTTRYEINEEVDTREYNLYASRGNTIIPDIKKDYCDK